MSKESNGAVRTGLEPRTHPGIDLWTYRGHRFYAWKLPETRGPNAGNWTGAYEGMKVGYSFTGYRDHVDYSFPKEVLQSEVDVICKFCRWIDFCDRVQEWQRDCQESRPMWRE